MALTPDEELELLLKTFQRCIDDKDTLADKSEEFTVDGAAYYRVTPGQRTLLMHMAPENIRELNEADDHLAFHALRSREPSPATLVAGHLAECTKASAALVVDGSADTIIAGMIAAGWTLKDGAEVVAGKRIRIMSPPPGVTIRTVSQEPRP